MSPPVIVIRAALDNLRPLLLGIQLLPPAVSEHQEVFFVYGDTLYQMSFMQLQTSGFQTITTVDCENKVAAQIVVPSHFVPCYIFYPLF